MGGLGLVRTRACSRASLFMTNLVRALCRMMTLAALATLSNAVPVGVRTRVAAAALAEVTQAM